MNNAYLFTRRFVASTIITSTFVLISVFLGAHVLESYGVFLFLVLPVLAGYINMTILLRGSRGSFTDLLFATASLCIVIATGLLAFAQEGVICLIMAAPIVIPLAFFGGYLVYRLGEHAYSCAERTLAIGIVALSPTLMGAEALLSQPRGDLVSVTTPMQIDAPPQVVWNQLVAFSEIEEEPSFFFRQGLAYPIRARVRGEGRGAIRYCDFSTGTFVEPITTWDEPRMLAFSVIETPPVMEEWNPFHDITPAHVRNSFKSERGQFLLIEQPDGSTRVEGTTWYRQTIRPGFYWRHWTDGIIHRIHGRVLRSIKRNAEAAAAA